MKLQIGDDVGVPTEPESERTACIVSQQEPQNQGLLMARGAVNNL